MILNAARTRRRLGVVLLLTLLPWPAVWLGMYRLDSLLWTFVLYHGVCLLPAVIWGRTLWRGTIRRPTPRQWALVLAAVLVVLPLVLYANARIGEDFFKSSALLTAVARRGFQPAWLLPLTLYFVPVNAVLEELFWRGVVLNELRGMDQAAWTAGAAWTAMTFAAWHYLVLHLLLRPGWAEAATLAILAAGIFFAWLYRRTQSIILPILWHGLVFDLALLVIFWAIVRAG